MPQDNFPSLSEGGEREREREGGLDCLLEDQVSCSASLTSRRSLLPIKNVLSQPRRLSCARSFKLPPILWPPCRRLCNFVRSITSCCWSILYASKCTKDACSVCKSTDAVAFTITEDRDNRGCCDTVVCSRGCSVRRQLKVEPTPLLLTKQATDAKQATFVFLYSCRGSTAFVAFLQFESIRKQQRNASRTCCRLNALHTIKRSTAERA